MRPFFYRHIQYILVCCLVVSSICVHALTPGETRHLLLRAGFGVDPVWYPQLLTLSRLQAVTRLLNPSPPVFDGPDCLSKTIVSADIRKAWKNNDREQYQKLIKQCNTELQMAAVSSLFASPAVLREHMTLFWHNHFTSSIGKVEETALIYQQHHMLYRLALGDFREMLYSVLNDPAMLLFLDNVASNKQRPNENLARELLELFTLGENHYTEQDIKEIARALTGQSVDRDALFAPRFYPSRHDFGEKVIFGKVGNFGTEGVAELILNNPQTANYITRKLWLEFVSKPDEPTIKKLAIQFGSNWDIRLLVQGILLSDAFWVDQGRMIKSPVELVAGVERLLPGSQVPISSAIPLLSRLGQAPFNPPNVKGWVGGKNWIDASKIMFRVMFSKQVLREIEGESSFENLSFICKEGGPSRFSALPEQLIINKDATCMEQLSSVLTDPIWQLK